MKKIIILAAIISLFAAGGCSKGVAKLPAEGDKAPEFTLRDMNGREIRLADFSGKVVMLNFWATWCPPCKGEIPSMARLNRQMAGQPFQMLAVSIDSDGKGAVQRFFPNNGAPIPVFLDPENKVSGRYGTTKVPETYIIGKNGVILKKIIGPLEWDQPEVVAFLNRAMGK